MIASRDHGILEIRRDLGHGGGNQRAVGLRCFLSRQESLVQKLRPLQGIRFHQRPLQHFRDGPHFLAALFEGELDVAAEIAPRQAGKRPVVLGAADLALQRTDAQALAQGRIKPTRPFRTLPEVSDGMPIGHRIGNQPFEPAFIGDAQHLGEGFGE